MRIGDWSSDVCSSDLAVGGKVDPRFGGGPLTLTGTVERLTDGRFVCDGPMWRGIAKSFGPTGVLRVGGVRILVVTNSMQITDVQHFKHAGIDPTAMATIGLKSMQHFRAAYQPLADEEIGRASWREQGCQSV